MTTEAQFLTQVTELAELRGWKFVHFRPAQTSKGWRTPVQGPLGKGWPDLFLVHEDGRVLAAELKRDGAHATPEQLECLIALRRASIPAIVWHPSDWLAIEETLR